MTPPTPPPTPTTISNPRRLMTRKLTIDISDEILGLIRQFADAAGMSPRRYVVTTVLERLARDRNHESARQQRGAEPAPQLTTLINPSDTGHTEHV